MCIVQGHTVSHLFSLLNDCLWYDKLWGPSQRVVTLFPYNLQWKRRDALLEVSEAAEHDAADPFHIFYIGPTMSFSMRPL